MVHASRWLLTNRMNELFTSGSVGGAAGNRCLYPAADPVGCANWQRWTLYGNLEKQARVRAGRLSSRPLVRPANLAFLAG